MQHLDPPLSGSTSPTDAGADVESLLTISHLRQRLFNIRSQPSFGPKGRYLIEDRKGSGGMANVYKARDTQLGVWVALKLLRADPWRTGSGSAADGQRLIREAQSLAQTPRAAHVARVYDAAEHDGVAYISMEYIDGVDLRRFQRERGRTQRDIIDAYLEAGHGLAELHRAGLVHLDFKPENVVVEAARDGRARRAVLVDLGLAARIGDAPVRPPALSGGEVEYSLYAFGGTPAYAAPERLMGRKFDARADQFSFCVAFYEALFRSHPFIGATMEEFMSTAREERPQIAESTVRLKYVHDVQAAIRQGHRVPVARDLRLPWGLLAALDRGMDADPTRRFASMDDLLRALTRGRRTANGIKRWVLPIAASLAVGGLSVQQYREMTMCSGFDDRVVAVWSPADADRVRAVFAGAPVAGTIIGALDDFSRDWTAAQESACTDARKTGRRSEQWLDRRSQCLERALGVVEDLRRQLVQEQATGEVSPDRLTILGDLLATCSSDDPEDTQPLRADDPLVKRLDALTAAEVLRPLDEVRGEAVLLLAEAEASKMPSMIAEAAFRLAHVLGQMMNDPIEGPANLKAADVALGTAIDAAGLARRPSLAAAALAFRLKLQAAARNGPGDAGELGQRLDDAQGIVASLGALEPEAQIAEAKGLYFLRLQRYEAASAEFLRSIALRETLIDRANRRRPDGTDGGIAVSLRVPLAKALSNLAETYNQAGDAEAARPQFERAIEEWRAVAGESSVYTLETRLNLLQLLQDMHDDAAADAERRRIQDVLFAPTRVAEPYAAARDRALRIRWDIVLAQSHIDAKRFAEGLPIIDALLKRELPPMKRSEVLLLRAEGCAGLGRWQCVREAAGEVLTMNGAGDPEHVELANTFLDQARAADGAAAPEPP